MADNYKFSQDYELIPPQKLRSYPISTTEWTIIKKKIIDIKDNINFWHTLGSILIGASISTLIAALINDFKTEKLLWTCWFAFVVTAICGALSFYFGKSQRQSQNKSKDDVIDFMTIVEERFQNSSPTNATTSTQDIIIHSAKYKFERNYIDVTEKIQSLIANGTIEFIVTNSLMGGDPFYLKQKTLEIDCTIKGNRKQISALEKATVKIE